MLTEYYDRFDVPGGDSLLVITSELVDGGESADAVLDAVRYKLPLAASVPAG